MKDASKLNYNVLLIVNSIFAFSIGILGPFYFLFVKDFGESATLSTYGISLGLLFFIQSIFVYFIGRFSDIIGKKKFLIWFGYFSAAVTLMYLFISEGWELYALQVANGFIIAAWQVLEISVLADITDRPNRGREIGRYKAIVGVFSAVALIVGGAVIGSFGYQTIFWIVALLQLGATTSLFLMIE